MKKMSDEVVQKYLRPNGPRGVGRWLMLLVNPFTYVAGWQALGWGLVVLAATVAVAVTGRIHYDGVMDMHISPVKAPGWLYAFEPVADWLIVALVFWLAGRIFSQSKQRGIDYFGTTAVARLPYLVAGLLWMPSLLGRFAEPLSRMAGAGEQILEQFMGLPGLPWLIIGLLTTMVLVAWLAVINYFALKESSGMTHTRALGVFVGAAIVAEIVSKLAIGLLANSVGLI